MRRLRQLEIPKYVFAKCIQFIFGEIRRPGEKEVRMHSHENDNLNLNHRQKRC